MIRASRLWRIAAGIYFFINFGGLVWAASEGEEMHMMLHVALLFVGVAAYVGWRLGRRSTPADTAVTEVAAERIEYLQQSVDAMALELERVGEAQRFND